MKTRKYVAPQAAPSGQPNRVVAGANHDLLCMTERPLDVGLGGVPKATVLGTLYRGLTVGASSVVRRWLLERGGFRSEHLQR